MDLHPSVIAKLRQVVKHDSRGLYKLSIGQIEPGALSSTLEVVNAGITIDTAAMIHLDSRQPSYTVERNHHEKFFSLVWVTILTGILKTIGVPVKLVVH